MELATAVLGWTPRTFWRSTPMEFGDALAGHLRRMGPVGPRAPKADVDGDGNPLPFGIKRDEIAELLELQEQAERDDAEERGEAA